MTSHNNSNIITLKTQTPMGSMTITTKTDAAEPIDFSEASKRILNIRRNDALKATLMPWEVMPMMVFAFASYQTMLWQAVADSYSATPKRLQAL